MGKSTNNNRRAWNNIPFLMGQLALTDFKLRYNNSVLGYFWSLLNPLLIFGVYYLVFSVFMRFEGISHYPLYLLLGILLWSYFAESTSNGMASIQYKASLISKINFPKWVIVVSSNLTSMLTLVVNMLIFSAFFVISGAPFFSGMPVFILCLAQLIILSMGVSFLLSSFYLRFRDLSHIWGILTQALFWLTPIIYPPDIIPSGFKYFFMLNPMARIIEDSRDILIYGRMPGLLDTVVTVVIISFILVVGIGIFNMRARKFAEEI